MCIFLYFLGNEGTSRTTLNLYSIAAVDAIERLLFVLFIPQNALRGELLPRQAFLPPCISNCIVKSMGSTNNSRLAEEQGVARATAKMCRVVEERAERERFRREMNRREKEIREQRERERMEMEARGMVAASSWPQQQEAISGLDDKVSSFYFILYNNARFKVKM